MPDVSPPATTFLHRMPAGWVAATGTVGGPNYDEFIDDDQIIATLARRPDSVVALDLPQYTAEARRSGLDFTASLPLAARQLQSMKDAGLYAPAPNALFAYQLTEPDGHVVRALTGLVRGDEFSSSPGEPGRIIRNEDVFASKVTERQDHIAALAHLLSPVLLIPAHRQAAYDDLLTRLFDALPEVPAVTDTDERGVTHALWPIEDSDEQIGAVLDTEEFLVADGNHRSLAAQTRSPWALVVIASATGLRIEPYDRLLRLPDLTPADLIERLTAAGLDLTPAADPTAVTDPTTPAADPGRAAAGYPDADFLYTAGTYRQISWPRAQPTPDGASGERPDSAGLADLPHTLAEQLILGKALDLAPHAEEISYVGGYERRPYLVGEVDAGRATAALLLRPVTVAEFTAVNAARRQMPRKSTWFLPKARAGLVITAITQ